MYTILLSSKQLSANLTSVLKQQTINQPIIFEIKIETNLNSLSICPGSARSATLQGFFHFSKRFWRLNGVSGEKIKAILAVRLFQQKNKCLCLLATCVIPMLDKLKAENISLDEAAACK